MAKNKPLQIQLELFQSTKQLNLSETYENIPKEIVANDPAIKWETENIALPVEKVFSMGEETFCAEISPATIKDPKTGKYKTFFPGFREARIEYAIISMASKQIVNIDKDKENNKIFILRTTYYQIQKEIVEAINKRENKSLTPRDCPYNTASMKQALEILKRTNISVTNANGESKYIFTRIKDIYLENKKVVIELNNMITNYISTGEWNTTDSHSILASKSYYPLKIRTLLNLNFKYASPGRSYSPSLNLLIQKMSFTEYKSKRQTLFRIIKILESMHEIEKVVVDKKTEGKKIVDAIIHIFPSNSFISTMIENNQLNKRVKDAKMENGSVIIEPMECDFKSSAEYQKAKNNYLINK